MSDDRIPVYISKKLYEEIEKKLSEFSREFKNVDDFVEFALSELMKEEEPYTKEEEETVKRRLRDLGYF
ncbi:MAG: CopG family transcriptional regulator [Aigarchaeota archaeon]|nr:CopG family transcriptional regulator [Aigarchaeota archaeon]MDW7986886.1 CopG family transcriptional regulator [Nitrososphaerota archaeon]